MGEYREISDGQQNPTLNDDMVDSLFWVEQNVMEEIVKKTGKLDVLVTKWV